MQCLEGWGGGRNRCKQDDIGHPNHMSGVRP